MTRFEWDNAKAASNVRKHKVSFEQAAFVFDDPNAMITDDDHHAEQRFVIVGLSEVGVLLVAFAERGEDVIRIISARRATKKEEQDYERNKAV